MHDEFLEQIPEGVRHDADICAFCADQAAGSKPTASVPSGAEPSDASTEESLTPEGGIAETMSDKANETLSRETHEALPAKAVQDATSTTEAALERKTSEVAELTAKADKLEADKRRSPRTTSD